jgi:hypothetical protein
LACRWPSDGIASAYARGIRGIFSVLVRLSFLLGGQPRAVAWVLLIATTVPVMDGLIMMKFSSYRSSYSERLAG